MKNTKCCLFYKTHYISYYESKTKIYVTYYINRKIKIFTYEMHNNVYYIFYKWKK